MSQSVGQQTARANQALIFVSLSVLLATSTWFSGTAATLSLKQAWSLNDAQSAWLTISVQLGFITGTFLYAIFNLADVFNARKVFFASALMAALFNAGFAFLSQELMVAVAFRFLTGVTLAGVYPVGMKIVASWFQSGLGWRLGVMVGALTLGTATPFLMQALGTDFEWRWLVASASIASAAGAFIMIGLVKDGPFLPKKAVFDVRMMFKVFRHPPFRNTAFGYFGHMWELYAFWSLISFYLSASLQSYPDVQELLAWMVFSVIGIGTLGCVLGGWISRTIGERRVALVSLLISAAFCGLSGFIFSWSPLILMPLLLVWGFFVIADSPQFSALAARYAPPEYTGTALTIQNGIGFAITVISIQLLPWIAVVVDWQWAFLFLMPGPLLGAYFMFRLKRESDEARHPLAG